MKIQDLIIKTEKVKWQDLKDLQPENLKIPYHNEKTKKSIIKNGFAQAIYVWQNPETQELYITDGHLRKELLIELVNDGFEVPDELSCTFLDNTVIKTKQQASIILLEVFNTKKNPMDGDNLKDWLEDIDLSVDDVAFDNLDLKIDINEEIEVEKLEPSEKDDEVREPAEKYTFVNKGDVWLLGKHRLMCGDSTVITDVEKLMDGKRADMVFTDPPYKIETKGGCNGNIGKGLQKQGSDIEFIADFNPADFLNILPTIFNGIINAYVFCNKELLPDYLNWARDNKYSFNVLIWKKPNAIPIGDSHRPDIEYLLLFRKNAIWNNGINGVNYSRCLEYGREKGLHPTMKPIEMIVNEILISSNVMSIVTDFFAGSGSTLIACEKTKRICYTMELDEHYCGVVINRYKDFIGSDKDIFLLQDGKKIPYTDIVKIIKTQC